jgi:Uma2 family endonuclease
MAITKPRTRRWTLREYYRLADQGWFRGQRVELIDGEIVQMPAMKNPHVAAIELVKRALEPAFGPAFWVRMQGPLHFGRYSAPEPDVAVVPGGPRDYSDHPTTALLVVEVSESTLAYDRNRKAGLYARHGIADYWIVNLIDMQLEVRRNPVPDPGWRHRFRYADVQVLGPGDRVTPLALPGVAVAVSDLLP